jgi:hypothetical protein
MNRDATPFRAAKGRVPVRCPHCGGKIGLCLVSAIRTAILEADTRLPVTPGEASRIALRVVYGDASPRLSDDPLVRVRKLVAEDEE